MTPAQQVSADGIRGLATAGILLLILFFGLVLAPRLWPRFASHPHAGTLALAWTCLVAAWAFNGASLYCAGREAYVLAWLCYGLSAAWRLALVAVVVWRVIAVGREKRRQGAERR